MISNDTGPVISPHAAVPAGEHRHTISAFVHEMNAVIDANGATLADQAPVLREEHALLEHVGTTLEAALDRPACVGLVSLQQERKADLGLRLAGGMPPGGTARIAGVTVSYPAQVSFCTPDDATSMVLRLTRSVRETKPDFPLALDVMGELDLVEIVAGIALEEVDLVSGGERIAAQVRLACEAALQIREPWQGGTISAEDTLALRDRLLARFPDHPHLKRLDACGYWESLRAVIAHLSVFDRAEILAQIWAGQKQITLLYNQLSQALERLDFAAGVRTGIDAILSFDELERPVASQTSILRAGLVSELMQRVEQPVIVVTPTGKQLSLARPVLAALGRQMHVEVLSQGDPIGLGADVLDFPRLPLSGEVERPLRPRPLDGAFAGGRLALLLKRFAQEKAVHLLRRATVAHDATALVVTAPLLAARAPDDPRVLTDWVQRMQGATPEERDLVEPGIFVALCGDSEQWVEHALQRTESAPGTLLGDGGATQPAATAPGAPAMARTGDADSIANALAHALQSVFASSPSVAVRWGASAPFRNVVLFRTGDAAGRGLFDRGAGGAELGLNLKRAKDWHAAGHAFTAEMIATPFCPDPMLLWSEAGKPNDGGAGYLARLLTPMMQRQIKVAQIQREFTRIAARLVRRLQYHVRVPAGEGLAPVAREREFVATAQRLQGLVGTGLFADLLDQLMLDQDQLTRLLTTVHAHPAVVSGRASGLNRARQPASTAAGLTDQGEIFGGRGSRSEAGRPASRRTIDLDVAQPDGEAGAIAIDFAIAALRLWIKRLRTLALHRGAQERYNLSEQMFINLVEELIAGALRRDLRTTMANAIRPMMEAGIHDAAAAPDVASTVICDAVGRYVMWLGYEDAWTSAYPARPGTDSQGIFAPRMTIKGQSPAVNVATQNATFTLDWITAFKALSIENSKSFRSRQIRRSQLLAPEQR